MRALVGVQAQEVRPSHISLWNRCQPATETKLTPSTAQTPDGTRLVSPADVTALLESSKRLVSLWAQRHTLHLHLTQEFPCIQTAFAFREWRAATVAVEPHIRGSAQSYTKQRFCKNGGTEEQFEGAVERVSNARKPRAASMHPPLLCRPGPLARVQVGRELDRKGSMTKTDLSAKALRCPAALQKVWSALPCCSELRLTALVLWLLSLRRDLGHVC